MLETHAGEVTSAKVRGVGTKACQESRARKCRESYADTHKARIMGEHIADYMREMEEDDEENFQKYFAKYIEESY